jgi:hypothetical protein
VSLNTPGAFATTGEVSGESAGQYSTDLTSGGESASLLREMHLYVEDFAEGHPFSGPRVASWINSESTHAAWDVAAYGNFIAMSSKRRHHGCGAVYVFVREFNATFHAQCVESGAQLTECNGWEWRLAQRLAPQNSDMSDGCAVNVMSPQFGASISLWGRRLLVGAPGATYERNMTLLPSPKGPFMWHVTERGYPCSSTCGGTSEHPVYCIERNNLPVDNSYCSGVGFPATYTPPGMSSFPCNATTMACSVACGTPCAAGGEPRRKGGEWGNCGPIAPSVGLVPSTYCDGIRSRVDECYDKFGTLDSSGVSCQGLPQLHSRWMCDPAPRHCDHGWVPCLCFIPLALCA